jgi:biopolymer transport protein ExbB/TolQ
MLGPGSIEMLLAFALGVALWIGLPVAIFVFARRLLRAVERRSVGESQLAELTDRLHRLEERCGQIADDAERLREEQRFTQQLLTERAAAEPRSSSGAA